MVTDPHASTSTAIPAYRLASFYQRLRGLLGRPPPEAGTAVWLCPCRQIHTLGMSYAIDALHLDANGVVVSVQTLTPWQVGRYVRTAKGVLELRAGEAGRLGLGIGVAVRLLDIERRVTKK